MFTDSDDIAGLWFLRSLFFTVHSYDNKPSKTNMFLKNLANKLKSSVTIFTDSDDRLVKLHSFNLFVGLVLASTRITYW